MRLWSRLLLLGLGASLSFAQLTMDQKISDFQALTALYAKRYAPYEWKKEALNFDLLDTTAWLAKVQATTNDLDFYEVMAEYVSSLNDAHDGYVLPAIFSARLNFTVDLYDGKLLVDTINRVRLPTEEFPFLIGYELVSIDGQDAQKLLDGLLRYEVAANPRSTRRLAAQLLTIHPQNLMPHATDTPDISTVVFRRPDGDLESYHIPWTKSGLPLVSVGRYFTPASVAPRVTAGRTAGEALGDDPPAFDEPPAYLQVLARLQNCRIADKELIGFGAVAPIFASSLPSSFVQRLGKVPADPFFSGVFDAGGFKIGFIRIPNYGPSDPTGALNAFAKEIVFFQANTDGLVIDDMRNPGGAVDYVNQILSLVIPTTWRSIAFEVRSTSEWVMDISSALEQAKATGAPQFVLDLLQALKDEIRSANHQLRGRTKPIPLDDVVIDRDPAMDSTGKVIAYTKPFIVLVDELSASAAEVFAATIQDNARAPLFGWRTMGAGGSVEAWYAGSYSLGYSTVTESLMNRKTSIVTGEYPAAPYVENIGVRPEISADYMTRDNLTQNGRPFVNAFTAAIVDQIRKSK